MRGIGGVRGSVVRGNCEVGEWWGSGIELNLNLLQSYNIHMFTQ